MQKKHFCFVGPGPAFQRQNWGGQEEIEGAVKRAPGAPRQHTVVGGHAQTVDVWRKKDASRVVDRGRIKFFTVSFRSEGEFHRSLDIESINDSGGSPKESTTVGQDRRGTRAMWGGAGERVGSIHEENWESGDG